MKIVVRFDDICPTMNWHRWDIMEEVLDRLGIAPILAIVPENRDPGLVVGPPNPAFWDRARSWQTKGWIIGLHGLTHVHDSNDGGVFPWSDRSEFAGHPREVQRSRVEEGLAILSRNGVRPHVWVSPSHGYDGTTLSVLSEAGITSISDGIGYRPYRGPHDLVHIPLLPWWSKSWRLPLNTLCVHLNNARSLTELIKQLTSLRSVALGQSFSYEQLLNSAGPITSADWHFRKLYWSAWRLRRRIVDAFRTEAA